MRAMSLGLIKGVVDEVEQVRLLPSNLLSSVCVHVAGGVCVYVCIPL